MKRIIKKSIIPTIIIAVTIFVIFFVINFYLNSIITYQLRDLIENQEQSMYHIEFADVSTQIFKGDLTIHDIKVSSMSDSTTNLNKNKFIEVSLNELKLEGVNIRLLFDNSLKIRTVKFKNLNIKSLISEIYDKKEKNNLFNINDLNINKINSIDIDNIELINLIYSSQKLNPKGKNENIFHTLPLNFNINGVSLKHSKNDGFNWNDIRTNIEITNAGVIFDKYHYQLSFENSIMRFDNQNLKIKNILFTPTLEKTDFANLYPYSRQIYSASLDILEFSEFNLLDFLDNRGLITTSIDLAGLDVSIYNDKSKLENKSKIILMPQISLKNTKIPILIDKVNIKNSKLSIEEKITHKDSTMQFFISNINGQIKNIKNRKYNNPNLTMSMTGKLMGDALINLKVKSPLNSSNNNLYWEGHIGHFKFRVLDKVLYPVLGLKILSGKLNRIDFKASSNNMESKGEMTMLYENLHASVLKTHTSQENHFLTSVTNGLIHKRNPNKRGKVKTVRMYYKRNPYKGLGNYIWKTVQNGIINTITPLRKRARKLE